MDSPSLNNQRSAYTAQIAHSIQNERINSVQRNLPRISNVAHRLARCLYKCIDPDALQAQVLQPNLLKFGQRAVVSSNTDLVVDQSARNLANTRKVLPHNRFNLTANGRKANVFSTNNLLSEVLNGQRPLAHLTRHDRLDFIGHGNKTHFEDYTPAVLADCVVASGLQEIGVIKLAACDIGKGQFLEEFAQALINRGVRFGYLSAPKSFSSDMRFTFKALNRDRTIAPFFFFPRKFSGPLPEKFNMKTVKGNLDISFKDSRYKQ